MKHLVVASLVMLWWIVGCFADEAMRRKALIEEYGFDAPCAVAPFSFGKIGIEIEASCMRPLVEEGLPFSSIMKFNSEWVASTIAAQYSKPWGDRVGAEWSQCGRYIIRWMRGSSLEARERVCTAFESDYVPAGPPEELFGAQQVSVDSTGLEGASEAWLSPRLGAMYLVRTTPVDLEKFKKLTARQPRTPINDYRAFAHGVDGLVLVGARGGSSCIGFVESCDGEKLPRTHPDYQKRTYQDCEIALEELMEARCWPDALKE